MKITGVRYYGEDFAFHYGSVTVENGLFARLEPSAETAPANCSMLWPGLVDIHLHGNSGADFSDGDYNGLVKMARYLASVGVTSFSPASMTLPEAALEKACRTAARLRDEAPAHAAVLRGITMEGPFFNAAKKGAQAAEYLRLPDIALFRRLQKAASGLIRIA